MVRQKTWIVWLMIGIAALMLTACELPSPSVGDVQVLDGETTDDGTTTDGEPADTGSEDGDSGTADEGDTSTGSGDEEPADTGSDTGEGDTSTDGEETEDGGEGDTADSGDGDNATDEGSEGSDEPSDDSSPRPQDDDSADSDEGDSEDGAAEDSDGDADASTDGDTDADTGGEEDTAGTDEGDASAEGESDGETTGTDPNVTPARVHTVAAGENLYRIGLQYNVSWTTLAAHNNIVNPNSLQVGQQINIPASGPGSPGTPDPAVTPTPTDETVYIVAPGDNLFLIGLRYGLDWTQIAEANGLVNPNFIQAGQVLKIPADQPGSSPEFSHVVAPGETLFLISLRYGVTWEAIAEKNEIEAPHVIFPGQPLIIPSGD